MALYAEIKFVEAPSELSVGQEVKINVGADFDWPESEWFWKTVLAAKADNGAKDEDPAFHSTKSVGHQHELKLGSMPNAPLNITVRAYANRQNVDWTWDAW